MWVHTNTTTFFQCYKKHILHIICRTTSRSAPPSNRVASVPQPTQRSNSSSGSNRAPVVNMPTMPNGPPPPSPVVKQQSSSGGVSSRSQYAHAPHLGGGSSSQRSSSQGMTAQQLQQQRSIPSSSRSNAGMPPGIVTQPTSRSSSGSGSNQSNINMSDKEKKEKERFLMFTRVLMKWVCFSPNGVILLDIDRKEKMKTYLLTLSLNHTHIFPHTQC